MELVAPGTSEVAFTRTSVSGESVTHTRSGVPLVRLCGLVGVTLLDVVSIEVPAGAAVSVTVCAVPTVSSSKQARPLASVTWTAIDHERRPGERMLARAEVGVLGGLGDQDRARGLVDVGAVTTLAAASSG